MLGIVMYPRTLWFLRAVRAHLTAARYVLLAALSRTLRPICIQLAQATRNGKWPSWANDATWSAARNVSVTRGRREGSANAQLHFSVADETVARPKRACYQCIP
ncbi:conserved hypothetical protein [Xanthomonas campestris pv. campestris str. 8004]|uniref:Uncharacterized protein n=1 Tax=Xanthomonas campestris pv. campestris (strain 8004) TaxID=314565 RepID=A0A0H2X528_XANC8|nr:conserved hypothetical protein [Xanthomonas campestris pv. campestris str. 8004]